MLHKVFDTADLPARGRVDAWHDFVADLLIPYRFHIDPTPAFRGALQATDLGAAQVVTTTYSTLRCERTAAMIRRSDPELYMIGLPLRGRQGMAHARRQATIHVGDMVLYSSSRPHEVWTRAALGTAASVVAQIPRAMLPLPSTRVDSLLGTPISGREGMGALLTHLLGHLVSDTAGTYRPDDAPRLGTVLLDLVTTLLAHHLDDPAAAPPEARDHTDFLRIKAFIHQHLADPDLTAETIAAAHHVSRRHLQRLFQRHGHSVAAYVRHQRLALARRLLAEPALADEPIRAIAARCGFSHPEVFTRAFRARYGMTPRDYRTRALGEPSEHATDEADG